MKVRLLGTGGADGVPGFWVDTEVGRYARAHGGKDVRTRTAAVIDDLIKVDFGADTYAQATREGLNAADWKAVVFTHTHNDHFAPAELQYCVSPFTDQELPPFEIWGNEAVCSAIQATYPTWPVNLSRSYESFYFRDYEVTAIRAKHKEEEDSHNLLVRKFGSCLLYATDTGIWEDETWDFLSGWLVHALVIECSEGVNESDYDGHLNVPKCLEVVGRLREMQVLRSQSQVITTHHAAKGGATHGQLEDLLKPHGIQVGFDGLVIEL